MNLGCRLNLEHKNYPMKKFRAIFFISLILVIRSAYAKKRSFLNISCNSKYMLFIYIWVADLNSNHKNYPMKEFRAIFPITSILVNMYAKKGQFSILGVFQNVWDLHKFGLQIWIQNAKITLWKNFWQFFRFHRFRSSGPGVQKKIIFQY